MLIALHRAVAHVAPISEVVVGDQNNPSTYTIVFAPHATSDERAAAQAVLAAFDPQASTGDDIVRERTRRLALGFNYNFGDVRGVHRIGTTTADLEGWSEVSTYAGALLDSGDTTTKIAIVTDTGPCEVTAPEWRAVEIAAAQFRQPIWARSFLLMQTLPADYTSDAHWS